MRTQDLARLSDDALRRDLTRAVAQERSCTALVIAHLAEFQSRKLYRDAGYPSMAAYCVEELRFSEDAAFKRIRVARAVHDHPATLTALEAGRLHLTAVKVLAPHLTPENAAELIALAEHKTRFQVEQLIARRFPTSEELPLAEVQPGAATQEAAPNVTEPTCKLAPEPVAAPCERSTVKPHAPGRVTLRLSMDESTHELLREVQDLVSHRIPTGDLAEVIRLALRSLKSQLERRKFASTHRPSRSRRANRSAHDIPAHVRRAVWERDRGCCTFVGDDGRVCGSRRLVEFDHGRPTACGGLSTVSNVRLRCRSHNALEAERVFGTGFMEARCEEARRKRARRAAAVVSGAPITTRGPAVAEPTSVDAAGAERMNEVLGCLRTLGLPSGDALRAARAAFEGNAAVSLEESVRAAIRYYGAVIRPIGRRTAVPSGAPSNDAPGAVP